MATPINAAMAAAELAMRAGPPLIDLISGRSRRIAEQQGRPFHWSDVFFGAPDLREQYMAESAKQYNEMLKQMGPFAAQLFSGSPDAFSPMYQQAMQRFQTEIAPQIAGSYGRYGGTRYAGAMPQSLAQAGRMMGTDLAAQQMQAQLGLMGQLLGGMPAMRQAGKLQEERPGLFELLNAPMEQKSSSPLQQLMAMGFNRLGGMGGPSAATRAATPLGVDTSGYGQFSLGPTLPQTRGGYGL